MTISTDLLQNWDIANLTVTPIDSVWHSTWDIGGRYILKRYSDPNALSQGLRLPQLLAPYGIPVAAVIPTKNGQPASPDGLYCLMTKLPGCQADFYETPELAIELGRELARLHLALADLGASASCYDCHLLKDWQNNIKPSLVDVPEAVVADVDARFCEMYPKLPRQLIHRDVHLQNVLFDGGRVSGWLDFDIGQRNVRLFDLAYLLSGLLVGNTDNPEKIELWRSVYRDLLKGYDESSPLSDAEREALPILIIVIEFLFVHFFEERGNAEQREAARALALWFYAGYTHGTLV